MARACLLLLLPLILSLAVAGAASAAAPAITEVKIQRGPVLWEDGLLCHCDCQWVTVTDGDGLDDVTVTVSNSFGHVQDLGVDDIVTRIDTFTGVYSCYDGAPGPAPSGTTTYTIAVSDSGGNGETLGPLDAPPIVESFPQLTSPAPQAKALVHEGRPTFAWTADPSRDYDCLEVYNRYTWALVWDCVTTDGGAGVPYGGSTDLGPGPLYSWHVTSCWLQEVLGMDDRVSIWSASTAIGTFCVAPGPEPPPVLPPGSLGKFAYRSILDNWWTWLRAYDIDAGDWPTLGTGNAGYEETGDWSPDGTRLIYTSWSLVPGQDTICVDYLDGSSPTPVPGACGLWPQWAPDGTRVAYTHYDYGTGEGDVWVAAVDGSVAYPLAASPGIAERFPDWSPDGQWVVYDRRAVGQLGQVWVVRYDAAESHAVTATAVVDYPGYEVIWMACPRWSPDGSMLAVNFGALPPEGLAGGIKGIGTLSPEGGPITPVFLVLPDVVCCAMPGWPAWSPDGTQIVFTSGHHLDPQPAWGQYEPGAELWIISADGSGVPSRVTYNSTYDAHVSWWAPDTEVGSEVSVTRCDTTITFEQVISPGVTTAVVTETPPGPEPQGFQFLGDYYDISTTAQVSGMITIQIHYEDADVPAGWEQWLSLLHWENGHWVDVTIRPIDTVNNIITGQCTSLSPFAIAAYTAQFDGLLPPVNNDGSSIFKLKSTVPVKFRLTTASGTPIADAAARLYVAKVTEQVVGTYVEAESTASADSGNTFRCDAAAGQYIFNLGTKGLSAGTYSLQVTVNGVVMKEVWISLR